MMLFDHLGIGQYFWISIISVMALSFAVWENRSYHKEIWYWITLVFFFLFHVYLVIVIGEHKWLTSIGHGNAGHGVVLVAIVDGLIISAVIRFPDWITSTLAWFFSDNAERTAK